MPEGVDVWVTPLVRDAEGDLPEVVLSRIAERAPSSDNDAEVLVDFDVAGVTPLAIAEVASSTDFSGAASPAALAGAFLADLAGAFPADLVGMAFPAVAGVASPAVLAEMAVPAIAGVTSPAVLAGMAIPAVAGAASLAVVEVASSTDRYRSYGGLWCSGRPYPG